ncbi:MAG: UDP-glucose 4-epimerase [Nitrosomonadaceae bacterium]|nr:UDP-glucose 4-epimerase [Nitrosomonadaceae bacterium]
MNGHRVMVTGGAGYVGAVLVPRLLSLGYGVTVLDLMLYGDDVIDDHVNLTVVKGDIRDHTLICEILPGHDIVIHLACISNDPSFELDPAMGQSINLDAFRPLVEASRDLGVERFIYASSSSVYGVSNEPSVHEDVPLVPLTDYSKFKAECEEILAEYSSDDFCVVTARPATVCGYSRRQRLDVVVNIFSNLAYHNRFISVFGGSQIRPNIHIEDMVDAYILLLESPKEVVTGRIYNVGLENQTVLELAETVRSVMGEDVVLDVTPTDDPRSYRISSERIERELGFKPSRTIKMAVEDMKRAFEANLLPDSLSSDRYFNIQRMQSFWKEEEL